MKYVRATFNLPHWEGLHYDYFAFNDDVNDELINNVLNIEYNYNIEVWMHIIDNDDISYVKNRLFGLFDKYSKEDCIRSIHREINRLEEKIKGLKDLIEEEK